MLQEEMGFSFLCPTCDDYIYVQPDVVNLRRLPVRGAVLLGELPDEEVMRYIFVEHSNPDTGIRCDNSGGEASKQEVEDALHEVYKIPSGFGLLFFDDLDDLGDDLDDW